MKISGRHRKFKNAAGFTLIEVLVAVVVIALGCLAVLAFHSSAVRGGAQADSLTAASFLAESQVELLRSLDFGAVDAALSEMGAGTACLAGNADPCADFDVCHIECLTREGEPCQGGACFQRTTGLITQAPTSRTHTVSIAVEWRGPVRRHRIVHESLISAYGVSN